MLLQPRKRLRRQTGYPLLQDGQQFVGRQFGGQTDRQECPVIRRELVEQFEYPRDGHLLRRYSDRLGKVKVGSANVTFKRLADLDLDALRQLLKDVRSTVTAA